MDRDFIFPVLRCVLAAELDSLQRGFDTDEIRACISELRFLNVCLWWFSRYAEVDCGEENWKDLKSMLDAIGCTWGNVVGDELEEVGWEYIGDEQHMNIPLHLSDVWEDGSSEIEGAIEECKLHIREHCANLLHCTFKYSSAPSADHVLKFLDDILQHLKRCIAGEAVSLKKQIENLEEKYMLLHTFFKLVPDDCVLELRDFRTGLYNDINKLAWLTFFFWVKAGDEDIEAQLNVLLSDMSRKIVKPSGPDAARWYFAALKAMRLQRSEDALLLGQAVPALLDLLFDHMEVLLLEDFQILRDGMIILVTFWANPPKDYAEDEELLLILDQLGDLLCQGSGCIPPVDDDARKVHLSNFETNIIRLKSKIRTLHRLIPDSSSYNFPRPDGIGFIRFLLQNWKENLNSDKMFIPFAKHLITKVEQELASLSPDLDEIFELQKEHKEVQDTWLQLINLAYLTECAVNSCSVILHPIWYNMVCLEDILDEIKVIRGKLDVVKHSDSYNAVVIPKSVGSEGDIPTQAWNSKANEVMVGCEEEIDAIVDQLTRGPKSLEIVSIVGMGGSGKTTLARKVYDTHQVRTHFHIFAFCTVSQVYTTRKLLLEILKGINAAFVDDESKTDDDLAHVLHKQLSGKRYLVVMDDIWKIDAWKKVKSSFPDESDGSRVIFTTREGEVARKSKSKFSPHSKQMLSDKESWELLLQTMAFPKAGFPPNLSEVGQVIARNCGGLPLAVTVIGCLLARKDRSLALWNEIAEKTSSFAAEEGCVKVLELSYMHLPEHLKSCFLYLGVFAEDELIPSKRLMLLWIAEGFVQKSETERVEIVALEYLSELVDRSLVHVAKRGSDDGIKTCQLHDIIRDFCQRKAQEENIFQQIHGIEAYNSSHYRLSINMEWQAFADTEHRHPEINSLLYRGGLLSDYECDGRESIFTKFQLAQVLDLANVLFAGEKDEVNRVIESVTLLVHLRYLAVSIWEEHVPIPSRIADLKNLETLFIRGREEYGWGESFWRMEKLRHVDVGRCNLIPCPSKFEAYPLLYSLECFSTLVLIGTRTAKILLERLPNLRKLSCILDRDFDSDLIFELDVLSKLEALKVTLGDGVNVILPATLKKLSLKADHLPSQLGDLPCLEVLKIDGNSEKRWDVEDGEFPMLKFLKIEDSHLEEWNVSDGSFPSLEQLFVDSYDLHEIPAIFSESTTLKRIQVCSWKSNLTSSAREVQDEQTDLGNEIQLIVSDPWDSSGEEDD